MESCWSKFRDTKSLVSRLRTLHITRPARSSACTPRSWSPRASKPAAWSWRACPARAESGPGRCLQGSSCRSSARWTAAAGWTRPPRRSSPTTLRCSRSRHGPRPAAAERTATRCTCSSGRREPSQRGPPGGWWLVTAGKTVSSDGGTWLQATSEDHQRRGYRRLAYGSASSRMPHAVRWPQSPGCRATLSSPSCEHYTSGCRLDKNR